MRSFLLLLLISAFTIAATAQKTTAPKAATQFPSTAELQKLAAQFAPTQMRVNVSALSVGDRQALIKLIQAARILNDIYMDQLWSGDRALYAKLQKDRTALGKARLVYFWINKGPWDDLNGYKAFIPGVPPRKPLGANFYPDDMTKEEFESWVKSPPKNPSGNGTWCYEGKSFESTGDLSCGDLNPSEATGFFTTIRRVHWYKSLSEKYSGLMQTGTTTLAAIPYSEVYRPDLEKCAALLREAAAVTDNSTLKKFLTSRADAFLSNDYYQSDLDWMDLDAPLDITIGPYETYNDELFGYNAAFEAYINLRDDRETAKLTAFAASLQEIENNLPEESQYRNPKLGTGAPIRVVNEVLSAGDGDHGVQTAAYNLPNDERVVQQKGSKRVMLKNVQEAKFRTVLIPIARRMLAANEQGDLSFELFFTHILCHELMHGLGPQQITLDGRQTSPRKELKELYSAIEEAKADATGLWALQYMMDHAEAMHLSGVLKSDEAAQRQLYTTYLASAFRSLRFGLGDAHGKGMALQFNYLLDKGGFVARPDGTFAVDMTKIKSAVQDLTHDLLTVEAHGDYAGAEKMLELAVIRPEVKKALDRLQGIPVDIEPIFVTADELAPVGGAPLQAPGTVNRNRRGRGKR